MILRALCSSSVLALLLLWIGSGCSSSPKPSPDGDATSASRDYIRELEEQWVAILDSVRRDDLVQMKAQLAALALDRDAILRLSDFARLSDLKTESEIVRECMELDASAAALRWIDGPNIARCLAPYREVRVSFPFESQPIRDSAAVARALFSGCQVELRGSDPIETITVGLFLWDGRRWFLSNATQDWFALLHTESMADRRRSIAKIEIGAIAEQVMLYRETRSQLPDGLGVLVDSQLIKNVQGDGSVLDPWKRPYVYALDRTLPAGFLIFSRGADPDIPEDDIRSDELERDSGSRH